tara:strand:- start:3260 stop:3517 length:258 start_codon:yes stop_codon:yes gene_type:complete
MKNTNNNTQTNCEEGNTEYRYCNYATQDDGAFIVAGGGIGNGNAYAQVEKINNKYYYCEYGANPCREYVGDKIELFDDNEFSIYS